MVKAFYEKLNHAVIDCRNGDCTLEIITTYASSQCIQCFFKEKPYLYSNIEKDKLHEKEILHVRKGERSYRFCMKTDQTNFRALQDELCENSIFLSKFHKIDEKVQKNITYKFLKNSQNQFIIINSSNEINCNIKCVWKRDRFAAYSLHFQRYSFQADYGPLFSLTEKLNKIRLPVIFQYSHSFDETFSNVVKVCKEQKMIPMDPNFVPIKRPIHFEKMFGGISELSCFPLDDWKNCRQTHLHEYTNIDLVLAKCKLPEINNQLILREGLSKYSYKIKE